MNYRIQIDEEAEDEIRSAKDWYENRSWGLGEKFIIEINESILSLLNPKIDHKLVFKHYRRLLLRNFPYTVYYMRDETELVIRIIAVLHNKQSRDRLENRI